MPWNLKGRMIESCSCHVICPCWLPLDDVIMDRGWCDGALLFRIDEGRSGRVDLGGRTVAVALAFPGPTLGAGHGTARVYLDDAASADQRPALEAIFQGRWGGGMQGFGSLVSTWLRTESTPISVEEKEGTVIAVVGTYGTIRSKRLRNEKGRVVRLHNITLFKASPVDLAPSGTEWHDPELPRSFRTESGGAGRISWKG